MNKGKEIIIAGFTFANGYKDLLWLGVCLLVSLGGFGIALWLMTL